MNRSRCSQVSEILSSIEGKIIGIVALALALAAGAWARQVWARGREASRNSFHAASMERLRTDPQLLSKLRGRVTKIGMLTQEVDFGSSSGTCTRYESFLITDDGAVIDLERLEDDVTVEQNARWLADQLGVPFEHD